VITPIPFLGEFAQFGATGLIAAMWLIERRSASTRERQITEAHDHIANQRVQLGALIRIVRENTRALSALEHAQQVLCATLSEGMCRRRHDGAGEPTEDR